MIVFYSAKINEQRGVLDQEDSRHCSKVLRKKEGEEIIVMDGNGNKHECVIVGITRNEVVFDIVNSHSHELKPYLPNIAISILKNTSRFEWFLEKATEIGVSDIQPLVCERTLRTKQRTDRSQSIVISAMKQSLRLYLPKVKEAASFEEIVSKVDVEQKFICHYHPKNLHLYDVLESGKPSYILVGPEGDFSDTELELAKNNGFKSVNISDNRLRTETAGIMVSQIIAVKNRNK